jgi:hypothetical protein
MDTESDKSRPGARPALHVLAEGNSLQPLGYVDPNDTRLLVEWLDRRYDLRFGPREGTDKAPGGTVERRTGGTHGAVTNPAPGGSEAVSAGFCGHLGPQGRTCTLWEGAEHERIGRNIVHEHGIYSWLEPLPPEPEHPEHPEHPELCGMAPEPAPRQHDPGALMEEPDLYEQGEGDDRG